MGKPTIKNRTDEQIESDYREYQQIVEKLQQTKELDGNAQAKLMNSDTLFNLDYPQYATDGTTAVKMTEGKELSSHFFLVDPRLMNGKVTLDEAECYYHEEGTSRYFDGTGQKNLIAEEYEDVRKLSAEELLDHFTSLTVKKPKEPKLGFFGKILNAIGNLIPALRPEEMKKYDREMEVYNARRCGTFEEVTGAKTGRDYNRKLLDERYAKKYINGEIDAKTYKAEYEKDLPAAEEKKRVAEGNRVTKIRGKVTTKKDMAIDFVEKLEENCKTPAQRRGAEAVLQYLEQDTPESETMINELRTGYIITKDPKANLDGYLKTWTALFEKVDRNLGETSSPEQINEAVASVAREKYDLAPKAARPEAAGVQMQKDRTIE